MSQLALELPTPRRIDTTIETLARIIDGLDESERARLARLAAWNVVVIVQRLRALERAEMEVLPTTQQPMADTYDAIIEPGSINAADALVAVFRHVYGHG